jgi:drug/metabolite transporter (DMT)-like permease
MTSAALSLILVAAVLHATWNYWAKKAGGGLPFVYLVGLLINTGYVPVVTFYVWWKPPSLTLTVAAAIFFSGILKTGYSLFLQRGYRTGDFSLIYPLARGTGPLLSSLGALIVFSERPTPLGIAGGLLIVASIFWLAGGHRWFIGREAARTETLSTQDGAAAPPLPVSHGSRAVWYGLISGLFIAAYTLWDKRGVGHLLIAPVLYDAGTAFTQLVLLTPLAWRRRAEVAQEWRIHRTNALIMAGVSPVSYVLVLTAMRFTPVSYVAPAREVSILIGMFFGARFLKERDLRRRVWAGLTMVIGIVALAIG